jgi:hypothetical protein
MSFFNWYIIVRFNIPCSICYLNLFTYIGVQHDFHIRWCSCRVTFIQHVPLVRQELPTFPEHPSPHRVFFCIVSSFSIYSFFKPFFHFHSWQQLIIIKECHYSDLLDEFWNIIWILYTKYYRTAINAVPHVCKHSLCQS